jgi:hypothetical protein
MDIEVNQKLDLEAGQRVQERVQYYFVTLTFTLLALSIETANFDGSNISQVSELLGWVALLTSGIAGLSRLNFLPSNYKISIHRSSIQSDIDSTRKLIKEGNKTILLQKTDKKVEAEPYLSDKLKILGSLEEKESVLLNKQSVLMRVHRSALLLGLVLLLISRGIDHACSLII